MNESTENKIKRDRRKNEKLKKKLKKTHSHRIELNLFITIIMNENYYTRGA